MFEPYNYSFNLATQANLDEADPLTYCQNKNMALDQYNMSPSSLECSPQGKDIHLDQELDNSFEKDSQLSHAQQVWKASVAYVNLAANADEKGFNNDLLYRSYSASLPATTHLTDIIKSNRLFKVKERREFMEDLEKQTELCGLLVELMLLFNHKIFNEIAYVVYRIWANKYSAFRQNKQKNQTSFMPSFSNFFGFSGEQNGFGNSFSFNDQSSTSQIVGASSEGIEELAHELFLSKKMKYLNLQQLRNSKLNRSQSISEFTVFVKSLSKAVFLSAEGIYEEETQVSSFSEEEQDESFASTGAKFARLFSQIQEDNEQALPLQRTSKHVKKE